jgi:hypothetical protein
MHRFTSFAIASVVAASALSASAQEPARAAGPGARGGGARSGGAQQPTDALNDLAGLLREFERNYATALNVYTPEATVRDAPYSGTGTTTTTQILADGTRIERSTTARVWRDRMGRVRREQTAVGLGPLNANDAVAVITITDPVAGLSYNLDPVNKTARSNRYVALGNAVAGLRSAGAGARGRGQGPAQAAQTEALGTRDIEGVKAVGSRRTTTVPIGQIGNDRPFNITYEQWESPELQVLVQSRQSDPRTGIVEYRLTAIVRQEPPPDLFAVPSDYTVINPNVGLTFGVTGGRVGGPATPPAPGTGGRGGGRSNSIDGF